jgi:hypothetical protein
MDTAEDMKRAFVRRLVAMVSLTATLGLCGTGRAAVSDHLFWGQILQGHLYDDPAYETPLHVFQLQVETDASVDSVEFLTPAGYWDLIPSDESTYSDEVETYHWTYDSTHVWEYWGYFVDPGVVGEFYGDGEYVVILHYANGAEDETTVWYGVPGTTQAIAAPTQKPNLTWPPYDGVVASPVVLEWDPVTDANVWDIFVSVLDPNGRYVISDVYDANAIRSDPCGLSEGTYDAELSFENFYPITNPDGIPFDLLKSTTLLHPFEVVYGTVYRFWSPVVNRHFYTIDEAEKNKLIDEYSHVWIFEGPAFHAWATKYFPSLAPVHRFWSDLSSSHFYTIGEAEKDFLIANYPHFWTYEGVAFHAYPEDSQPTDASPVYRFWNPSDNSHFYTIDPQEAEKILTQYSHAFIFEGIAFYAYP